MKLWPGVCVCQGEGVVPERLLEAEGSVAHMGGTQWLVGGPPGGGDGGYWGWGRDEGRLGGAGRDFLGKSPKRVGLPYCVTSRHRRGGAE